MVTLRYKLGGDYSEPPTGALDTSIFSDLSHDFQVDFVAGDGFGALDKTTGQSVEFTDAETHERVTDGFTGVYADLSDVTGHLTILGGRSGDIIIAGSNDDTLDGNGGNDILEGGAGADAYDGGRGFDTVSYAHAGASVTIDQFLGGNEGEADGDTFTDVEAIIGTAHDDTFYISGAYIVEGGAGADGIFNVANFAGAPRNLLTVSYEHSAEGVHVDLSGATANTGGDAEGDSFGDVHNVIGSTHADTLIGMTEAGVLKGYGGLDTITGGAGNDTIAVTGKWAAIDGGDGIDRLIVRGTGPNGAPISLDAGSLVNVEKVIIANGTYLDLSLQSSIDGAIKLNSRSDGFAGVFGTGSDDRIIGGLGNDLIIGAGGRDRLTGGAGMDIFAFVNSGRSGVITDFSGHNGDGDQIAFSSTTAPTFVETFSGIGTAEVRAETVKAGFQIVLFDGDGDGNADAAIRVRSADALTADDFYNPPPFGGQSTETLSSHHAVVEALMPHDITGLI